jgi:hypothetical protein
MHVDMYAYTCVVAEKVATQQGIIHPEHAQPKKKEARGERSVRQAPAIMIGTTKKNENKSVDEKKVVLLLVPLYVNIS